MKHVAQLTVIYKICSGDVWESIRRSAEWSGSADDQRDGFIHFSAEHQLAGTIQKHFAGRSDLVILTVDAKQLGENLKWEASRNGELFPHLYVPLPIAAVLNVRVL